MFFHLFFRRKIKTSARKRSKFFRVLYFFLFMLQGCMFFYAHKIKKTTKAAARHLDVLVENHVNGGDFRKRRRRHHNNGSSRKTTTLKDLFDKEEVADSSSGQSTTDILIEKIKIYKHTEEPSGIIRRTRLDEILREIDKPNEDGQLSFTVVRELFSVFWASLAYRGLPAPRDRNGNGIQAEDLEENYMDPNWVYLEVIYKILHKLVCHCEPKALSKDPHCLTKRFISMLLECFMSQDKRERDALKAILHRVYDRFVFYRSFMRTSIKNILVQVAFGGCDDHPGVAEILEFSESIINGLSVPLKEEHKVFLKKVLLPMHRPKGLSSYHSQLQSCVLQFLHKDEKLVSVVVCDLLKFWPLTNCQKEMLFLDELEEVLGFADEGDFRKFVLPFSRRLAKCISSTHLQVAERVHFMFNNKHFFNLASTQLQIMMPPLVDALEKNIRDHWNLNLREQSKDLKKMLEEMFPTHYRESLEKLQEKKSQEDQVRIMRDNMWEQLEKMAKTTTEVSIRRDNMWEQLERMAITGTDITSLSHRKHDSEPTTPCMFHY